MANIRQHCNGTIYTKWQYLNLRHEYQVFIELLSRLPRKMRPDTQTRISIVYPHTNRYQAYQKTSRRDVDSKKKVFSANVGEILATIGVHLIGII